MSEFKVGEKIKVWALGAKENVKIFLYEKGGRFYCVAHGHEEHFNNGYVSYGVAGWPNAKKIEKKPFTIRKIRELMRDGYLFREGERDLSDITRICTNGCGRTIQIFGFWYTLYEFCKTYKAVDLDGKELELME